jgi:putative FmdB family regulatory protein
MPTYSYKCPECGHEYTKIQKITDNSRARCPQCAARGERVITGGGGLIFKGSGFYITDYKRTPEKEKAGDKGDKGEKTDKTEKKSEGSKKPETKKGDGS